MIRQFLDYNQSCPLCDSKLKLSLSTAKARDAEIEGDNLKVQFDLNNFPYKKGTNKSKAILYINIDTGALIIDMFNSSDEVQETSVPVSRISTIYKMLGRSHQLHKGCLGCGKYGYSSGFIQLQLRDSASYFPFNEIIRSERISVGKETATQAYSYEVCNYYSGNSCKVYFGKVTKTEYKEFMSKGTIDGLALNPLAFPGTMDLPILDFKNPEALLNKLETLVIFH
jgi:hypothetical protein